jgi:hypothetical protein
MKSMASLVVLGAAVLALIADDTLPHPGGLTVHEWGTFTSVAGEDGFAIDWDVLGGKDDLPGFVNNHGLPCFKGSFTTTVRMETPVMYFYSPREVTARVKVLFPHGVITEWYPNGDNAIYESKSLMDQMGATTKSRIYSDDDVYQTKSLLDPAPKWARADARETEPVAEWNRRFAAQSDGRDRLERYQNPAGFDGGFSR